MADMKCYLNASAEAVSSIGCCIDSVATRTVCGRLQRATYVSEQSEMHPFRHLERSFKFGQTVHACLHASPVSISLPNSSTMHFEVPVIALHVPFLLHLDVLLKYGVALDFGTGHMRARRG